MIKFPLVGLALYACLVCPCFAQPFENTLTMSENDVSPKATLADIAWIQGHWRGEAFGGIVEEIWSPPLGGSIMGSFKTVNNGKVGFYELEIIREIEETLILQLKHFGNDLKGWEEKDDTVDFRLVKITPDRVYFDGYTLEKVDKNHLNVYVIIGGKEKSEVKFAYSRVVEY